MGTASVVILTKNAMPVFRNVLERVLTQRTPWPYEVIVIDSGSLDGTVEFARAQRRVRVISIQPEDFGHGKTRNLAIEESSGEFVALLTHDAQPFDENWLFNLVSAVKQDERIAGAFGKHVAYPEATLFTKRDLEEHFKGFLRHPLIVHRDLDVDKYTNDVGWRQFLHFFSNNNSCLRRSVWEKYPYPDVEFAEDQIWAQEIIAAGYAKAYAPDAVVYHSHDYGTFERLQRSFDEAMAFNKLFGYRLCESFGQLLRSAFALSMNDVRFARDTYAVNLRFTELATQFSRNFAHLAGQYLGTHYKALPGPLIRMISRDKRLQMSMTDQSV